MTNIPHKHLWKSILIGMLFGILFGWLLTESGWISPELAAQAIPWISLPGQVFVGLLKVVIVPLVMTSIIVGLINAGDLIFLKHMSMRLLPYFVLTTALAITIGISLASIVQPGDSITQRPIEQSVSINQETAAAVSALTVPQRFMNALPTNPAEAVLDRNMLQIVVLSLIIGVVCLQLQKSQVKGFTDLCRFGQEASMKVVDWAMSFAPLAVFSLMATVIQNMGIEALTGVGKYAFCVVAGLLTIFLAYTLILKFIAQEKLFSFLRGIREAQLIAFSTSSSSATMPVTIRCAQDNCNLPPRITGFTIPLGATVNMDGTALYLATATVFLCQVYGIDLSLTETIMLVITTIGASIGTPAMPGVGLVVLATILTNIGVPTEGMALILGVDRLLDMCRTVINITGDLTATAVMNQWMKGKL